MARKRNERCSNVGMEKFKKIMSLEKNMIEHNFKLI